MTQQERLRYLFDRCMSKTVTPEEQEELKELLLLPQNEELSRRLISESMLSENEYRLPPSAANNILAAIFNSQKEDEQGTVPVLPYKKSRRPFIRYAAAALIFGLLAGSVYILSKDVDKAIPIGRKFSSVDQLNTRDVLPGSNQAVLTLANGKKIMLNDVGNGKLAEQEHTVIINLNGQLSYKPAGGYAEQTSYNTISVPRKGQYRLVLSDGTRVWLNAESTFRYPVVFTGKDRTVELNGEGYFEVAKNPEKPFYVKAGGISVMALGTHFNVMNYNNEASMEATLLEGLVRVTMIHGNEWGILKPGQQASLNRSTNAFTTKSADVDEVMAWKDGYFLFNTKTSLEAVMRQMERWYDIEVVFEGTGSRQNFGGGIQRSLPLSGVLAVLQQSGIKLRMNGRQLTILK